MPIPRIEPIVIPAVPLPPGPTRGITPPTRGITPPRMLEPTIEYPVIDAPNYTPSGDEQGQGQQQGAPQDDEVTRESSFPPLPDPNTIIDLPPDEPVIDIPFTEYAFPAPDAQVLSTTASAAFVATTSALAATTALKPVMDSLFKVLKAVFKKVLAKITKKKIPDFSQVPTVVLSQQSLDRFRFDSSRPYKGPQYQRKADRKGKKGGKKPQPE